MSAVELYAALVDPSRFIDADLSEGHYAVRDIWDRRLEWKGCEGCDLRWGAGWMPHRFRSRVRWMRVT